MSVRKHPRNPGWYIIEYYPNGRQPDPVTGKVKQERIPFKGTEAAAREIEIELRQKHRGTPAVRVNRPISQMFPDWLTAFKTDHSINTYDNVLVTSKKLLAHFGRYQVNSLTQAHFDTYKSARLADGVKPRTVQKELAYFRSFINWAVENKHAQELPFKIKTFPGKMTKAPLPIVPTREEVLKIIGEMKPPKTIIARLMASGGLRRSEACGLTAESVDLQNRALILSGKGGKWRVIPIADPVLFEELKALVESIGKGPLFINAATKAPYKDIRDSIKAAAVRAGVSKRVYNHVLRHGFGAHMTGAGVGLRTLQEVMGHSDVRTTTLYTQIVAATAHNELSRLFTPETPPGKP